jgi:hypothetical protein
MFPVRYEHHPGKKNTVREKTEESNCGIHIPSGLETRLESSGPRHVYMSIHFNAEHVFLEDFHLRVNNIR